MEKITCETCEIVVAEADTYDEASEIALYEEDANDNHGEVWECALCHDRRMQEAFAEYQRERPKIEAQLRIDAQAKAWDDYLGRADLANDYRKENP